MTDLHKVQEFIIELSTTAIDTLNTSMDYLLANNIEGALSVIDHDIHINRLEEEINDRVILLIAKQQPVATDLRRLMVLLKLLLIWNE